MQQSLQLLALECQSHAATAAALKRALFLSQLTIMVARQLQVGNIHMMALAMELFPVPLVTVEAFQ
jgi:hypothetical protein